MGITAASDVAHLTSSSSPGSRSGSGSERIAISVVVLVVVVVVVVVLVVVLVSVPVAPHPLELPRCPGPNGLGKMTASGYCCVPADATPSWRQAR